MYVVLYIYLKVSRAHDERVRAPIKKMFFRRHSRGTLAR